MTLRDKLTNFFRKRSDPIEQLFDMAVVSLYDFQVRLLAKARLGKEDLYTLAREKLTVLESQRLASEIAGFDYNFHNYARNFLSAPKYHESALRDLLERYLRTDPDMAFKDHLVQTTVCNLIEYTQALEAEDLTPAKRRKALVSYVRKCFRGQKPSVYNLIAELLVQIVKQ